MFSPPSSKLHVNVLSPLFEFCHQGAKSSWKTRCLWYGTNCGTTVRRLAMGREYDLSVSSTSVICPIWLKPSSCSLINSITVMATTLTTAWKNGIETGPGTNTSGYTSLTPVNIHDCLLSNTEQIWVDYFVFILKVFYLFKCLLYIYIVFFICLVILFAFDLYAVLIYFTQMLHYSGRQKGHGPGGNSPIATADSTGVESQRLLLLIHKIS